ncbi:hypothetical protein BBJ28_00012639, partial [Nothophytophthora sp. Chile5]
PGSRVTFLVDIMEKMGCKMDSSFFSSVDCEGKINGGFHLDDEGKPGVVLCQNHIPDQEWMDRTMAHELVHAFDHCRNKIDWNNCEHHACSEIRAAALSGDCDWKFEFFRKNFNISKQHQVRVARLKVELKSPLSVLLLVLLVNYSLVVYAAFFFSAILDLHAAESEV